MMPLMVKEADLNRIDTPENYEVLDATALGRRLGFKRDTVLAYLSRRNFRRIPRPNRQLAMGPIWYEKSIREWEAIGGGWSAWQVGVPKVGVPTVSPRAGEKVLALYAQKVHSVRPPSEARYRRGLGYRSSVPKRSEAVRTLREFGLPPQDRAPTGSPVEG